jgi:hypothetical protein
LGRALAAWPGTGKVRLGAATALPVDAGAFGFSEVRVFVLPAVLPRLLRGTTRLGFLRWVAIGACLLFEGRV